MSSNLNWKQYSINEVANIFDFKRIPISKTKRMKMQGKYPYYGAASIIDYVNDYIFDGEYILLAEDGSVIKKDGSPVLQLVNGKFWVSNHSHVMQGNSKANTKFLYYYLKNIKIKPFITGSVQLKISQRNLSKITIFIPSIEEQKQISAILSSLDDKIKLNNQINKNLEEIAQTIFKHWFIDFEFPNENGVPYKSSGGEMVDSELSPIPKGWNIRSLNQIANFLNGLAMQKYRPENDEHYLPVLKIKELKIGETSKNSDKCSINIDPKYIVDDGDVVFSWSGSLEVKLWCGDKAGLNQHLFKVTSDNYPKWFYYYWIKHHIEYFRRIAEDKTTTMGHIKREHLSEAKVFDPGNKFFEKFNEVVSGLIELCINNEKEIKYLSQLRDILLPKLMSGEIRVLINDKEGDE